MLLFLLPLQLMALSSMAPMPNRLLLFAEELTAVIVWKMLEQACRVACSSEIRWWHEPAKLLVGRRRTKKPLMFFLLFRISYSFSAYWQRLPRLLHAFFSMYPADLLPPLPAASCFCGLSRRSSLYRLPRPLSRSCPKKLSWVWQNRNEALRHRAQQRRQWRQAKLSCLSLTCPHICVRVTSRFLVRKV